MIFAFKGLQVRAKSDQQFANGAQNRDFPGGLLFRVMTMTRAYSSILAGSQNGNRAEPAEIWKARKLIAEFSDEEISLTRIATQVRISGNYLSEKFKRVTGENFVRYVARVRTGKACDLLANSDKRVSEIAFAVGFQSLSQFNRVFKKLMRQSPTEFRVARRQPLGRKATARNARDIIRKNA